MLCAGGRFTSVIRWQWRVWHPARPVLSIHPHGPAQASQTWTVHPCIALVLPSCEAVYEPHCFDFTCPSIPAVTLRTCDRCQGKFVRLCQFSPVTASQGSPSIDQIPYTGSPYTNAISEAILNLQEEGILQALKKRWWQQKKGGGKCVRSVSVAPLTCY